jgi:CSLREA domain-containing protein
MNKSHFIVALFVILALGNSTVGATIFTVTSTGDGADSDLTDNICEDGTGGCTLRAALQQANDTLNPTGSTDTIEFNILGIGPHRIQPATLLPVITEAIVIDGYTQPNAIPNSLPFSNNAVIMIELDGSFAFPFPINNVGLNIDAAGSTVRGLAVHSFSTNIKIEQNNAVIEGNLIGLIASGYSPVENERSAHGVYVRNSADNRIGGTTPAARNVISGNGFSGIYLHLEATVNNVVQGNYIGTDITGTLAIPNGQTSIIRSRNVGAILIERSSDNTIGGNTVAARNVISGNREFGMHVGGAARNTIQGNWIGVAADGTPLGNDLSGILLLGHGNLVGGSAPGEGNLIAYNGLAGVQVAANGFPSAHRVSGNSIFQNSGLGIDLSPLRTCDSPTDASYACPDGVTPNDDSPDVDEIQNYPVLTGVIHSTDSTIIDGTLVSTPDMTYRIELFSSVLCDSSGFGEGEALVSTVDVSTDYGGNASFSVISAVTISPSDYLSATATNADNNTSEFSECLAANSPPVAICRDTTESAGPSCTAPSSVDDGSYDPDGGPISLNQAPPEPYGLGLTGVTLTATDNFDATGVCMATVTVIDGTNPTLTCPSDAVIPATSSVGASHSFTATAVDNCPGVTFSCAPSSDSVFAIGATVVNCNAQDGSGNIDACTFIVRVKGAEEQLTDLIALVVSLGFDHGRETSLVRKLQDAVRNLARGNERAACRKIGDFNREVMAQRDKDILLATADILLAESARIQAVIGC